ncbi:MAG TPA: beta-ketoacyl-[acyl-carrier-protein] synthase family protein [Polyangiaceae bacterium]
MKPRLWVTGLGLVTPLGGDAEASWARLVRGDRAMRAVRLFDTAGQRACLAAEVDDVRVPAGKDEGGWSRSSAMAATAAAEAMRQASVDVRSMRVGLVVAGTTGGMFENEHVLARLHAEPNSREMLVQMLSHPLTSTGDCLERALGPFARTRTLSSACSSGANAIVVAASWLLSAEVDVVVAGGCDGLCRLTLSGFNALAAADPDPCRPFDRRRRGLNLGEGAGFLVLERADAARARRGEARPIAELAGWALGAEAHHITNPAADGEVVAGLIERALAVSGVSPGEVDYVNAHGTGTVLNDAMEATALARALGREVLRVPVSSSKGQIGHTLGGAGAIEAAIAAMVVDRRVLVPTAGLEEPDPAMSLVHVPGVGRPVERVRAAMSNAFGFGGMDTVLVFKEPGPAAHLRGTAMAASSGPERTHAQPSTADAPLEVVVTGAAVFGVCGLLGSRACAALPGARFAVEAPVDADAHLDVVRARRLDRASRVAAVAVERALRDAGAPVEGTGVVLGSAYGNVDGSAAFMHRFFDKGPRASSPADFPNLVPSSLVGHVSIYLGLRGPTFATADLSASGESAFTQACQLVALGESPRIVAGGAEPRSDIVERVFSALFAHTPSQAHARRSDLCAALVVEAEPAARARDARILARVRQRVEWRSGVEAVSAIAPPVGSRAEVVLARADDEASALVERTGWSGRPRWTCAGALGENDALGAVALAVAVGRIVEGAADEVLALGIAMGRGYAIVLSR